MAEDRQEGRGSTLGVDMFQAKHIPEASRLYKLIGENGFAAAPLEISIGTVYLYKKGIVGEGCFGLAFESTENFIYRFEIDADGNISSAKQWVRCNPLSDWEQVACVKRVVDRIFEQVVGRLGEDKG